MATDPVHQPSAHSQRRMAAHARKKRQRSLAGYMLAVIAVAGLVALMCSFAGCADYRAVHDSSKALADDLDLYIDNSVPQPALTAEEQKLPPDEQTRVLTNRYNLLRTLGEELKKTAHKIEETLR